MLAGCAAAAVVLAGCGNLVDEDDLTSAGAAGFRVDADGRVTLVFHVCRGDVTSVVVHRDREGLAEEEPNPLVQRYRSAAERTGTVTLDLADPGPRWEPSTATDLEPDRGYLISAETEDSETSTVHLRGDSVGELEPGGIYTSTADAEDDTGRQFEAVTSREFTATARRACDGAD